MECERHPLSGSRWRRREALAGDASRRRYSRLVDAARGVTAVLCEYPPGTAQELARDLEVLEWCRSQGLRVPATVDCDREAGWILLEDFGEDDAEATLRGAGEGEREDLLHRTLQPLVVLSRVTADRLPNWNPALDAARLRFELAGFELWYLRHLRGIPPPPHLADWLDRLARAVAAHPLRVCHRDYHLNNLFFLDGGEIGVIDVQDILVGPDTYDAASLLAERATPELVTGEVRRRWLEEWAAAVAAAPGWRERWLQTRQQRALKVLGTFARLVIAGRTGYGAWLAALERRLAAEADELELPPVLTSLLVDLAGNGGPYVR